MISRALVIPASVALVANFGCSKPAEKRWAEPTPVNLYGGPNALPGRAPVVPIVDFVVNPENYDKKRIVLTGIWNRGWEWSSLDVENSAQDFKIWVAMNSTEIAKESPSLVEKFHGEGIAGGLYRIKAEGSFFFREFDATKRNGFGHLNMHEGYFLIDRLFEVERLPDKAR